MNTELGCKFMSIPSLLTVGCSDLINLILRKLGHSVFLPVSRSGSAFRNHIGHVIYVSAEPKMIRSNTKTNIATVAYFKSIGWSVVNQPTPYVCPHLTKASKILPPTANNASVSTIGDTSSPNPAWTKFRHVWRNWTIFVNLRPKPFWKRFGKTLRSQVLGRNLDTHRLVLRGTGYWPCRASSFIANNVEQFNQILVGLIVVWLGSGSVEPPRPFP